MILCKALVCLLLVSAIGLLETKGELTFDLNGQWKIVNANGSISVPAQVPGSVHTALISAGILSDPYYRFNDDVYKWVANDNWTYTYTFAATKDFVNKANVNLVSKGLDTIANVTLNGFVIGSSTNMFVRHVWNVQQALKVGENVIKVVFQSPVTYSSTRFGKYPYDVPPDCPPDVQHGFCHPNFIRKEQCSFSWDWGPGFAPIGIWKDIYLEAFDDSILRDMVAVPYPMGSPTPQWHLNVTTHFDLGHIGANESINATIYISLPTIGFQNHFDVTLKRDTKEMSHQVQVGEVNAWFPTGYGSQKMYPLNVTLSITRSGEESWKSARIAFKHVELIQEKIENSTGLSFYLKINNVPVFIKGSNWIPADSFQERITHRNLSQLLQSASLANINTLRVWGGGIYEQDYFYELCADLGIMVWQDFMFACAMYPTDKEFLASVREEVIYQTRRLTNHGNVIAWSANNENEKALRENWYNTNRNFTLYEIDYVNLYIEVIREAFLSQATRLPFMSSSPSNGLWTEEQGWVAKNPASVYYGDVHYYNYAADCWDISTYPKPRFASEYGVQSWPSFKTLSPISIATDWSYNSSFSEHRQHHMFGQAQMLAQIERHFSLPSSKDPLVYYKNLLHLTQISQALCIKFETEHYRRLQSVLINGQGHCMGALYWQLNDIWQGPSWSSIEYGGTWKMLHNYAKDFFSPILASGMIQGGDLYGYSITDNTNLVNHSFVTYVYSWSDLKPRYQITNYFSQNASSSKLIIKTPLAGILQKGGCGSEPTRSCFLTVEIHDQDHLFIPPTNPIFLTSFNNLLGLKKAYVKISSVTALGSKGFFISLKTAAIAPFVWLDSGGIKGYFSSNGFLMILPSYSVLFEAWEATTTDVLTKALTVSSLMDMY